MLKKFSAAAVLAFGACAAQAAPITYQFEWKGFERSYGESTIWSPDYTLGGYFSGEDSNGDGIITRNELTHFGLDVFGGIRPFLHDCPPVSPDTNGVTGCRVDAFTFTADGQLSFTAYAARSYGGSTYSSWYWRAPTSGFYTYSDLPWAEPYIYGWTEDTTLTLTAAPVPEPATWAMTGAGLLATAVLARRRKAA